MVIFAHPHQDPSSAVLNVLELLDACREVNRRWPVLWPEISFPENK